MRRSSVRDLAEAVGPRHRRAGKADRALLACRDPRRRATLEQVRAVLDLRLREAEH